MISGLSRNGPQAPNAALPDSDRPAPESRGSDLASSVSTNVLDRVPKYGRPLGLYQCPWMRQT